jgi:hypothetical protein
MTFNLFRRSKVEWFYLLMGLIVVIFLLCGCNDERDQSIANSAATIHEAAAAQEQGVSVANTVPAIKANADAIVKATGKTAVPAATSAVWVENTPKAQEAAGQQAKETGSLGAGGWAGIVGISVAALGLLRFAAPFIPGVGGVWKVGIDALWNLAQHKKAKQADVVQERLAQATQCALPLIQEVRTSLPDTWAKIPDPLRSALEAIQKAG